MSKWKKIKLGDVAVISSGNSAPQGDEFFINGIFPFCRTSDVGAVHLSTDLTEIKDKLNATGIKGLTLFPKGTILIPKSGASTFLNHRAILGLDSYVSSHLATIETNEKILFNLYAYYFLVTLDAKTLSPDTNYPTLKLSTIGNIEIPLPEMEEQRKIAARLDAVSDLLAKQKQLLAEQDTLIQSLFYDMFGDPIKNNKGWKIEKLGNIAELVDGDRGKNYPKDSDFSNDGYCLFLNTGNIKDLKFDFSNCQFISKEKDNILRKGKLKRNDIVFTTRGTIGKIVFYDTSVSYEHIRINSGMVIIRNLMGISSIFFLHYFSNPLVYRNLLSGTAQPQIPIGNLQKAKIIIPPLELQEKFAVIVEQIESEKSKIKSAITETQTLFNALMAEYFEE